MTDSNYSITGGRLWPGLATSARGLIVLLCLLMPALTVAQSPVTATLQPPLELREHWPAVPENSRDAQAVILTGTDPVHLRAGDRIGIQMPFFIDDTVAEFGIVEVGEFVNGDLVLHGLTDDGHQALTMTVGASAIFGQIEYRGRLISLRLNRSTADDTLAGWLYRVDNRLQPGLRQDYVIPERRRSAPRLHQPLALGSQDQSGGNLAASTTSSGADMEISQRFSTPNILVGQQKVVDLTITVRNTATAPRRLPPLDLYFLLEDTRILQLPAACAEYRNPAGQPYLRCRSGNDFAPGEVRSLVIRVTAGPEPQPVRLWSTALIGDLRHDAVLNVVRDVTANADDSGVSTFNASLLGSTTMDPLGNVVIDVLVLYTGQAQTLYGDRARTETRINQLFSVANQIYRDSGVGITLRPVHHRPVYYPQSYDMYTMLDNLTFGDHPSLSNVADLRSSYGADLVMLFTPLPDEASVCGLANLGGFNTRGDFQSFDDRDYAFSVIGIDCPFSSVVAHEAGHNMGLTHSHAEDGQGGTFPFATGHAEHGLFATVMADPSYFGDAERVARFSNPELNCFGRPCGVDHTDPDFGADAVRALNLVRFQIANYYPTRIAPLPSRQVASSAGTSTGSRIAMAATTDGGRSFVTRITPVDRIDLRAEFHIDDRHTGRQAVYHVVLYMGGQFLQLTADGHLLDWDGQKIEALVPFRDGPETLSAHSVLSILEQIQAPADFIGSQLQFFVAYQLLEESAAGAKPSGELIYTTEPLILDIVSP